MKRLLFLLIGILLLGTTLDSRASEQDLVGQEDSIRIDIGSVLEHTRDLLDDNSMRSIDSAIRLLDSAAIVVNQHFGAYDTLLARIYCSLSECYRSNADYKLSFTYAHKSLEIWEQADGENHVQVLVVHNILVERSLALHDLVSCEQASNVRFSILESIPRPLSAKEQEQMVEALNDRARLRVLQVRYEDAITDLKLAISMITDEMEEGERLHAALTGNVGWVLMFFPDRLREAEDYITKAYELARIAYHPKHPLVLTSLYFLGNLARQQGEYERADSLSDEELAFCKEIYGPSHPRLASALRSKAKLLLAQDSVRRAVSVAEQAVAINKAASDYPTDGLMGSLETAGIAALVARQHDLAVQRFDELITARHSFLKTVFGYASEQQKLDYVQQYSPIVDALICSAIMNPEAKANRSVLDMILRGKGLAIDALASEHSAAICANVPILDSLYALRKEICGKIARLSLSKHSGEEYLELLLDSLYDKKAEIETDLSALCSGLGSANRTGDISSSDLASALPARSVALEFLKYKRLDVGKLYKRDFSLGDCYIAIVVTPYNEVTLIDLGDAVPIDSLIGEYHAAISDALQEYLAGHMQESVERYEGIASLLYDYLIDPINQALTDKEIVFIAPDGQLNLLPFETLLAADGRYLIEDHRFVYLTSGRDLLKESHASESRGAIVMAYPDYMSNSSTLPMMTSTAGSSFLGLRGGARTPECLSSMFSPLPTTRQEGNRIASILRDKGAYNVTFLESARAQEEVLKYANEVPSVLHLATHGYFCSYVDRTAMSNPLLRSGLILAGANRTIGNLDEGDPVSEDGILTALEVSGLNLIGTNLVVLSACQTGVGEVQNGEGVFGLRRAFHHAGAQSLITSMFAVPDESTAILMERFYDNWLSGSSKSEALREASLSILNDQRKQHGAAHPLFWGGFVLLGNPN